MYSLYGQAFIQMIKSFNPMAKIASGGKEVVVRCLACGDSSNPRHAHMYISVPQSADELSFYQCKRCPAHGIVDDAFLRKYGCYDSRVLVDIVKHNSDVSKMPKYRTLKSMDIFPLRNAYISNQAWNQNKLNYVNSRIGSNFSYEDILKLKIFLNLYDVLSQNNLSITRDERIVQSLNEHFIGFISYDNSYCTMRKIDDIELYRILNKRYINYNLTGKPDDAKNFYVIPTQINIEDPMTINIHIAEGAFDVLSVYYNLNHCNNYQNIYISCSGKSYSQALSFILTETGIINYQIHIYSDNDVSDYELDRLILSPAKYLRSPLIIHRNGYSNEKDYGVPANRIKDSFRVIQPRII